MKKIIFNKEKKTRHDPTKTQTIRLQWIRQFNVRYNELKGDINRLIVKREIFNKRFNFESNIISLESFNVWLQGRIQAVIMDDVTNPQNLWQNQYIDRAYLRGIRITRNEIRKTGGKLPTFLEEIPTAPIGLIGTATPTLLIGGPAFTQAELLQSPIHLDSIRVLHTRDFTQLEGINAAMSQQINRVLVEGIEQGFGARQIAVNINDRIDKIGLTRARLLARTETVRAYNIGTINEGKDFREGLGEKPQYEWLTAQDERVRSTHASRNHKIYSEKQAYALIGEPNCRCSLVLYFPELDTLKKENERTALRKKTRKLIKKT